MIKYRIRASIKAAMIAAIKVDTLSSIKFIKFKRKKQVKQKINNFMFLDFFIIINSHPY